MTQDFTPKHVSLKENAIYHFMQHFCLNWILYSATDIQHHFDNEVLQLKSNRLHTSNANKKCLNTLFLYVISSLRLQGHAKHIFAYIILERRNIIPISTCMIRPWHVFLIKDSIFTSIPPVRKPATVKPTPISKQSRIQCLPPWE